MPRSDIPVITPYNPLDKRNLAESVASAMLHTPVQKLPPEPFIGAGVYAIYYKGDFEPYRKLVELNLPFLIPASMPDLQVDFLPVAILRFRMAPLRYRKSCPLYFLFV